jgi:hypothetical protein
MRQLQSLLERCLTTNWSRAASRVTDEFDLPSEFLPDDIFILGFREGGGVIAEMSLAQLSGRTECG